MQTSQRSKPTVILIGRVPQYGVGKRRLAGRNGTGIGNLKAWQFYRRNLSKTLRDLHDPRWNLKFAGTPDGLTPSGLWNSMVKQGQGDLGDRLIHQFNQHRGLVLLIGTDVPDLKATDISQVLNDLKRGSAVLGHGIPPLDDGGFWCLGIRRFAGKISPRMFRTVPWSSATTADTTSQSLTRHGFKVVETIRYNDVDDKQGYELYLKNHKNR